MNLPKKEKKTQNTDTHLGIQYRKSKNSKHFWVLVLMRQVNG